MGGVVGPDVLRFIFTAGLGPFGQSGLQDGAEMVRMSGSGRTGFGNYYAFGVNTVPNRRVEILDYDPNSDPYVNANEPQLRLTYNYNSNVNNGIWTDFQTTSLGDLYIHPSASNTNRRVGINTSTPGNTLEINSNGAYSAGNPGFSSLRFTDLRSGSSSITNPTNRVLSVDANGDVILVDDEVSPPGSGDVTACTSLGANDLYFVPKWDNIANKQLCRSDIFNSNGGNVGIHTNSINPSQPLFYGVQTKATSLFSLDPPASILTQYNTGGHPLGVLTSPGGSKGFCVYSSETAPGAHRDRLRVTARDDGKIFFESVARPIIFTSIGGPQQTYMEYMATDPSNNAVVMTNDFSTNPPSFHNYYRPKLYVEAAQSCYQNSAIIARNTGACASAGYIQYGIHAIADGVLNSGNPNTGNIAGFFESRGNFNFNFGVYAPVSYNNANRNIGGMFEGRGAISLNTGVVGVADPGTSTNNNGYSIGGDFSAQGSRFNYAVRARTPVGTCQNGLPVNCSDAAVYALGDVYYSGTLYNSSDLALKDNIQPLSNASSILSQLQPKTYEYKISQFPTINLPQNTHHGLIAQEVEVILPNLVKSFTEPAEMDSAGNVINPEVSVKAVNYIEFIPILIAGYNEQIATIDSLKDRLTEIENLLNATLPGSGLKNNPANVTEVTLENTIAIILDQNVPNPFADETKISYFLPEDVQNAKIIFYESSGKILKEVELKARGEGLLHVYGQDLSSGIYTYTLLIDGKPFETKKMIKTK